MMMAVLAAPFVALAFTYPLELPLLLGSSTLLLLPYAIMGYGSAFVQIITPIQFHGQVSAMLLFAMNFLAIGTGPALVCQLGERQQDNLGLVIAIVLATLLSAAIALRRALPALRILISTIR